MTAIVTNPFRLEAAKKFEDDVSTSSGYYLFVGRAEPWNDDTLPDSPYDNTYSYRTDVWQRMHSLKQITSADITYAVPRYQWISGQTYVAYDDRDDQLSTKMFYVISDNNNVYLCLKAGPGASITNPDNTGVQTVGIIDNTLSDGYIWKYLYTISADDTNKFLTSAFIPVRYISQQPAVGADTALDNQWKVQQAAVNGGIYNVKITDGGSGYTSAPTISVTGDGTGFAATCTIDANGSVDSITVTNEGSGYNQIALTFSGGGGQNAAAYAVLPPPGGFGSDPRNDLSAHYVAINIRLVYDDGSGDFIVNNDFRQIGIIRNPLEFGTSSVFTDTTGIATRSMVIDDSANFAADTIFEGLTSGAVAIVDSYVDVGSTATVKYHQTEATGFDDFQSGEFVREVGTSVAGAQISSLGDPEVEPYSGDIIFLENRTPVLRATDQIETIKLVLEF